MVSKMYLLIMVFIKKYLFVYNIINIPQANYFEGNKRSNK